MGALSEEITIIGGGLTGLSLAVGLRKRGVGVIVHEAGSYPRHRVCGEFISGVSVETLEELGIAGLFEGCHEHRSVSWFDEGRRFVNYELPSAAWGISRYVLDDRLYELALSLGVEVHTGSRVAPSGSPGVVWCAGRVPAAGGWIGLKAHVRGISPGANLEMHSGPVGYLGITPVEDGWNNLCGLFRVDKSIKARQRDLLPAYLEKNGNAALAGSLGGAEWREKSFSAVAGFRLGRQEGDDGLLMLGDSHAIIPPFTGNGMSMAFQSAEVALPFLVSYARDGEGWDAVVAGIGVALRRRFRRRLMASRLMHPFLFNGAIRPHLRHLPLNFVLKLLR